MKFRLAISFVLVLFVLSTVAYAEPVDTAKLATYIATAKDVGKRIDAFKDSDNPVTITGALYLATKLSRAAPKYKIDPVQMPDIKALDDRMRAELTVMVAKNILTSANLRSSIDALKNLKGGPKAATVSDIDFNVYKSPILYRSSTFGNLFGAVSPYTKIGIIPIIGLLLLFFIYRIRRPGTGFWSWLIKRRGILPNKKQALIAEDILKKFEEKKMHLEKNKANLAELNAMLAGREHETDIGKFWEILEKRKDFFEEWLNGPVRGIEELNAAIYNDLNRYLGIISKIQKLFGRRYVNAILADRQKIETLGGRLLGERTISTQVVGDVFKESQAAAISTKIKDVLSIMDEEVRLVTKEFYPEIDELANDVRRLEILLTSDHGEKMLLAIEKEILRKLITRNIPTGPKLLEELERLRTAKAEFLKLFEKEQEFIKNFAKVEKEQEILQEKLSEKERVAKKAVAITDDMRRYPLRYFATERALAPLYVKILEVDYHGNEGEYELDSIERMNQLIERMPSKTKSHMPSRSLPDISAYLMFRKRGDGRSELFHWIKDACENPELAIEIQALIDEENIPDKLKTKGMTVIHEGKPMLKTVVEIDPPLLAKLSRLRQRVTEALDDAYPPTK